jgi:hypothetical protein
VSNRFPVAGLGSASRWAVSGLERVARGGGHAGFSARSGRCAHVQDFFPGETKKDQVVSPPWILGEDTLIFSTWERIMARSQMSREKDGVYWLEEIRLAGGPMLTQSRQARQGEVGRSMNVPAAGLGSVSGCRLEALDGETGWLGWAGGEHWGKG